MEFLSKAGELLAQAQSVYLFLAVLGSVFFVFQLISTLFGGEIDGCEAVKKSYPNFFEDIKTLGIITHDT
jgi:hypothetical protein